MLLHATSDNKRAEQAVKCVSAARFDCATAAWDIMCERLDIRSFSRSLSLLDNLMFRQRPGQSLTEYVHFMRQTFDEYNEPCEMINGSAAIHRHNLGLLMLRGISITGHFGHAKQCVINAFDTNYFLPADEVMANILHLAENMDEDVATPGQQALTALPLSSAPLSMLVAVPIADAGTTHVALAVVPNKCSACGSLNHILSSGAASDEALLKWTLAKRKMIVQKYGTGGGGSASAHATLLSDVC
jgi:hypothetical protein